MSGWVFAALSGLGLGLSAIAAISVPLAVLWAWVALAIGKKQENWLIVLEITRSSMPPFQER